MKDFEVAVVGGSTLLVAVYPNKAKNECKSVSRGGKSFCQFWWHHTTRVCCSWKQCCLDMILDRNKAKINVVRSFGNTVLRLAIMQKARKKLTYCYWKKTLAATTLVKISLHHNAMCCNKWIRNVQVLTVKCVLNNRQLTSKRVKGFELAANMLV